MGNDNEEYRWKYSKGSGYVVSNIFLIIKSSRVLTTEVPSPSPSQLTHLTSGSEIARHALDPTIKEGFFRGEAKWALKIRPTSLDIDLVVLTFIILEKRRRDGLKCGGHKAVDREEAPCESGVDIGGI